MIGRDEWVELGDRYGEWVVVDEADRYGNGARRWTCRCSCGSTRAVSEATLLDGRSRSCGHLSRANISGQRFGRLVALEPTGEKSSNRSMIWRLVCDCGAEVEKPVSSLRGAKGVRSCGCLVAARARETGPHRAGLVDPDRELAYGYDAAHKQIRAMYGPASDWCCVGCGGRAAQWSYSPVPGGTELASTAERVATVFDSRRGGEREVRFSTEPSDYLPRCLPCHTSHDARQAKARQTAAVAA